MAANDSHPLLEPIKAAVDDYGFFEVFQGQYRYGVNSYGNYYQACSRSGATQNPIRLLNGNLPWRDPSGYNRFVRTFPKVVSTKTNSASPWSVPGVNYTGMILITNYDPYWKNNSPNIDSNLRAEADTKALNKLASRKAALGVSLGEVHKSAAMLAGTFTTLLSAYKQAKRGNWNGVRKSLGMTKQQVLTGLYPANKWLEYQYGWKPLMSDLYDQGLVIHDSIVNKPKTLLVSAKASAFRYHKHTDTFVANGHPYSRRREGAQLYTTYLTARISSPHLRGLDSLGLLNPLSIGWELVPFSFVFDWFCPFGAMLEALTAKVGLTFVGGTHSCRTGGVARVLRNSGSGAIIQGEVNLRVFFHNRSKLTTFPGPAIWIDDSPFSTSRTLSALALWRSVNSGSPRNLRL